MLKVIKRVLRLSGDLSKRISSTPLSAEIVPKSIPYASG